MAMKGDCERHAKLTIVFARHDDGRVVQGWHCPVCDATWIPTLFAGLWSKRKRLEHV